MTVIDLDLQLKFLNELDDALSDALKEYIDDNPEKLDELKYMRGEVKRARRVVTDRLSDDIDAERNNRRAAVGAVQEVAYR